MNTSYQKSNSGRNALIAVAVFLAIVCVFGYRLGANLRGNNTNVSAPVGDYYAVVSVSGTIQNASSTLTTSVSYNHTATVNYINTLANDSANRGIFLDLDTPGGTVYETDELYLALVDYAQRTRRPIWAYMNHQACSGGYYAAMAADKIYANRNTTTGSIGVIISVSDYSGLYDTLGIKTQYIVSGGNKAMGAADTPLSDEQRAIYQSIVDEAFAQFTGIVCAGRGMSEEELLPLADGRIYTAAQALEAGLIDEIASRDEALAAFAEETGAQGYYRSFTDYSWLDTLFAKVQNAAPKSDAEIIAALLESAQDGTAFYLMP